MSETPLDKAHGAMEAAPDDPRLRLSFFDHLASAELFLLLEAQAEGDQISPRLFVVEDGQVALVFDTEDRLSDLAGSAHYAVMTGRQLGVFLKGQGIGLGLNLGVAPSSFLLDPEGVNWFADMVSEQTEELQRRPREVLPPTKLPEHLISALDAKLAACVGMASGAFLSEVIYENGTHSHLLGFVDAEAGAEIALSSAMREALAFSGIEAGILDIAFFRATDPIVAKLSTVALRFDLPKPDRENAPIAPGTDPNRPPRLR